MTRVHALPDEAATLALGAGLAASLPRPSAGLLVTLDGELGAGKTTLVRALLRGLGHDGPVPSPTYTLVEPYDAGGHGVTHVDLYRVADESELEFLGWDDLRSTMLLVEWPERAPGLTSSADLHVELRYLATEAEAGAGREARLTPASQRALEWLERADAFIRIDS